MQITIQNIDELCEMMTDCEGAAATVMKLAVARDDDADIWMARMLLDHIEKLSKAMEALGRDPREDDASRASSGSMSLSRRCCTLPISFRARPPQPPVRAQRGIAAAI